MFLGTSGDNPCSLESRVMTHVPITSGDGPHVHLHECSSTPFRQRSREPTSPINSQGLYLAKVRTSSPKTPPYSPQYSHNLGIREFMADTTPVLLELDFALLSCRYTVVMSQAAVTIW